MTDFEKLSKAWYHLRHYDRVNLELETATMIFRLANEAICTRHERPSPDPRQITMELRGGKVRRVAVISVS